MAKKTYTRLFREQLVNTWFRARDTATFIEHCERFGVPRQTAYEWRARFEAGGSAALEAKSTAPRTCPHATDEATVALLLDARREHPTWGPRKLKAWLEDSTPWELNLPAPSTIGDILKRSGLVATKKRRTKRHRLATPFLDVEAPNDVWTTDFKGQFRLLNGRYCYPLTLADCFSRFLLRCDAYYSSSIECRRSFERAFIEYGLPRAIRSDNGSPFASSRSPAGLSRLSVWWVRLGIRPELITPASPWENGRHERMHRTLKAEATDPPQANCSQQQRSFNVFRTEFNEARPHEALGMKTPSRLYASSPHAYPRRLPELDYPDTHLRRRVSDIGVIGWSGARVFLSTALAGEIVGMVETEQDTWNVYFGPVLLGILDKRAPERGLHPPGDSE